MQSSTYFRRAAASLVAAGFAVVLTATAGFAASQFDGTWKVEDTKGNPFQITLSADCTAKADRAGEGLTGKWKEKKGSAVIKWDSGWTTKITKDGDQYKKIAYEKGKKPAAGEPSHSSNAEKVQ